MIVIPARGGDPGASSFRRTPESGLHAERVINLGTESRSLRTALMVFGAIFLLFGGYFAYWHYQYQRAESAATDFCAAATVGSDISDSIARVDRQKGMRGIDGENRYVVFFPGPIFNAFSCEIELAGRKVVSKRVVEPQD